MAYPYYAPPQAPLYAGTPYAGTPCNPGYAPAPAPAPGSSHPAYPPHLLSLQEPLPPPPNASLFAPFLPQPPSTPPLDLDKEFARDVQNPSWVYFKQEDKAHSPEEWIRFGRRFSGCGVDELWLTIQTLSMTQWIWFSDPIHVWRIMALYKHIDNPPIICSPSNKAPPAPYSVISTSAPSFNGASQPVPSTSAPATVKQNNDFSAFEGVTARHAKWDEFHASTRMAVDVPEITIKKIRPDYDMLGIVDCFADQVYNCPIASIRWVEKSGHNDRKPFPPDYRGPSHTVAIKMFNADLYRSLIDPDKTDWKHVGFDSTLVRLKNLDTGDFEKVCTWIKGNVGNIIQKINHTEPGPAGDAIIMTAVRMSDIKTADRLLELDWKLQWNEGTSEVLRKVEARKYRKLFKETKFVDSPFSGERRDLVPVAPVPQVAPVAYSTNGYAPLPSGQHSGGSASLQTPNLEGWQAQQRNPTYSQRIQPYQNGSHYNKDNHKPPPGLSRQSRNSRQNNTYPYSDRWRESQGRSNNYRDPNTHGGSRSPLSPSSPPGGTRSPPWPRSPPGQQNGGYVRSDRGPSVDKEPCTNLSKIRTDKDRAYASRVEERFPLGNCLTGPKATRPRTPDKVKELQDRSEPIQIDFPSPPEYPSPPFSSNIEPYSGTAASPTANKSILRTVNAPLAIGFILPPQGHLDSPGGSAAKEPLSVEPVPPEFVPNSLRTAAIGGDPRIGMIRNRQGPLHHTSRVQEPGFQPNLGLVAGASPIGLNMIESAVQGNINARGIAKNKVGFQQSWQFLSKSFLAKCQGVTIKQQAVLDIVAGNTLEAVMREQKVALVIQSLQQNSNSGRMGGVIRSSS